MKELKIQNSEKAALVNDEDYERLSKHTWVLRGNNCGNISRVIYGNLISLKGNKQVISISLANEIMQDYKSMFDHKDRNPFNNLRSNLRKANRSQNAINRAKQTGKRIKYSSRHKGVNWNTIHHKWQTRVTAKCKTYHLGYFDSEIDAALAYNVAASKYQGEFAVLNTVA